jgi:hypothetical protein
MLWTESGGERKEEKEEAHLVTRRRVMASVVGHRRGAAYPSTLCRLSVGGNILHIRNAWQYLHRRRRRRHQSSIVIVSHTEIESSLFHNIIMDSD